MVRLVIRWLESPWAFELVPGLNKLGRNPTNDFRISDPSVSSFHAEVFVEGDDVRIRDLGSTNGTFVDEQRVEESTIKAEQVLRLGNVRLKVEEVTVTPMCHVSGAAQPKSSGAQVELAPSCAYHGAVRAVYRCENCGGGFCQECVTVIGQGRFGATTVCPLCKGQCYPLPSPQPKSTDRQVSFLGRITQTLRISKPH